MPPRGNQPHERVCAANWRRSLCAAKRPRTPAGVNGSSVGAAYMPPAAYRDNPSTGKGEGCRPPLPLSFATHLWQSVGAGHARPAALLCHPFAFCIVGRGLDPSAASRRREPQKPLRPSLPLGHLPCEGRLSSRAPPAQKGPLVKGGWPRQRPGGFRRALPDCPSYPQTAGNPSASLALGTSL